MVSVGQSLNIGARTLAFSALDKSDTLNRFVNWISGGKVNRESLAQSIWRQAVALTSDMLVASKTLGERSAKLVPLVREAVVDNDMSRMKTAVAELASELLGNYMDRDGTGVLGLGRQAIDHAVRSSSAKLAELTVGDHATEKFVATMVKEHGWQPLENYLKNSLGAMPLGNFVCGTIKGIIQRSMVDKPEFDMSNNAEYRLAAGLAVAYLDGSKDYEKPLREYAPTLMALKDAGGMIRDAGGTIAEIGRATLDTLQDKLGIEPVSQTAQELQSAGLLEVSAPVITGTTAPRDLARALVGERLGLDEDEGMGVSVSDRLQAAESTLDEAQRDRLHNVVDLLSAEQIAPLGKRGGIDVGLTWAGTLDRVQAQSHKVGTMPESALRETTEALSRAPDAVVTLGGYRVGEGFSNQIKTLNLDLPKDSMGYTDSTVEASKALWNTGWSLLGYGNTGPDWADSAVLKQLYNVCGRDEATMTALTRYLDADLAKAALGEPMLRALAGEGENTLNIDGLQVRLDGGEPSVAFSVRNETHAVRIGIDVTYRIDAYGHGDKMREPVGDQASNVTVSAAIMIHPGRDGEPPRVECFPLAERTSIYNTVAFDRSSGDVVL